MGDQLARQTELLVRLNMPGVPRKSSRSLLSTKTVLVYRNGDTYFPGKRFVVNSRQLATFDSFLNAVTRGVAASFGAVRNVYTPREGHRVLSLDTLQHGEKYVAGGTERFKKVDYFNIFMKKQQRKSKETIQPVVHSRINVPARWGRIVYEPCIINVFTNGEILVPAARILIPKYTLLSWERVLAMVTEKVHLRTGAVHKLCRLDGTPVTTSRQLENNQYYVAVGVERFRLLPYFHWVPGRNIMQESSLGHCLPPAPKEKGKSNRDLSLPEGGDMDCTNSPFDLQQFADPRLDGNSLFYAKPDKKTQRYSENSKTQPLISSGDGSVFRVKHSRTEMSGAVEVQEDTHVQVDLPIDQMEASVVEEEQCEMTEQTTCHHRIPLPRSKMEAREVEEEQCYSEAPSPVSKVSEELSSSGRLTRILAPSEHLSLPSIDSAHPSSLPSIDDSSSAPSD